MAAKQPTKPKREPKPKPEPKAKAKAKSSKGPNGLGSRACAASSGMERGADMEHSASLVHSGADSTSAEPAPMSLEACPAQPMKRAVEQFLEAHHENEAGQGERTLGGTIGRCAAKPGGGSLAYPSASAGYREKEPDPQEPSPSILPMIRKALDSHEIMEYLADCEFRLDASTAKHGDTYRLFVDDYPTDMAIVCKGEHCTVGNKSHPNPADAARAICDALLAKIRAGGKRK